MAFYFSSDTNSLYDTDVFPEASLPANKVEITEAAYAELMTKQNQGYVIMADGSGNPYTVNQSEAAATDMKHSGSIATTLALGHVKIGDTMQTANDGTLDLKDEAVTTAKIADQNVTTEKLADGAVTTAKIEDSSVDVHKLADQNVTTEKLADGAVTTAKIEDSSVDVHKLAANSVTTEKILNGGVTTAKIADQNVTTEKLADGAVTEAKLDSVKALETDETSLTIVENVNGFELSVKDLGITAGKIADMAVIHKKLDSKFLFWDPAFESHRAGIETGVQNSALTSYSINYCNSEPVKIVFLKNTENFVLNNVVPSGTTKIYSEGNQVLIVNVNSVNDLYVRNSSNTVIKQIPSGSASLFVCVNSGNQLGQNSIWYPIL